MTKPITAMAVLSLERSWRDGQVASRAARLASVSQSSAQKYYLLFKARHVPRKGRAYIDRRNPPDDVLAERESRQQAGQTLTGLHMGDPPIGYGAGDKARQLLSLKAAIQEPEHPWQSSGAAS